MLEQLAEKTSTTLPQRCLPIIATPPYATALYDAYILNPRVEREMLTPYKVMLRRPARQGHGRTAGERWVQWVADSICLDDAWNPLGFRMSPQAVWRERKADALSRSIYSLSRARVRSVWRRVSTP